MPFAGASREDVISFLRTLQELGMQPTYNVDAEINILGGVDRAPLVWMTRLWPSLISASRVAEPETIHARNGPIGMPRGINEAP